MPNAAQMHWLQVLQSFYAGAFLVDSACIADQHLRLRSTGAGRKLSLPAQRPPLHTEAAVMSACVKQKVT
jgi:hypothetical protein